MPVVRINDNTFTDLSTLKNWFGTKSPSETIDKIVRDTMEELGIVSDDEAENIPTTPLTGAMVFETAPNLSFTKPTKAVINGQQLPNPNWASILHRLIAEVKIKGFEGEKLVREIAVPAKAENFEMDGYKFYPELGISVQGQSATDAWKEIERIANRWRIPVTVDFYWRQNPKAKHPGKAGIIRTGHK